MRKARTLTRTISPRGVSLALIAALAVTFCSCQSMRSQMSSLALRSQPATVAVDTDSHLSADKPDPQPVPGASRGSLSDGQDDQQPIVRQVSHQQPPAVGQSSPVTPQPMPAGQYMSPQPPVMMQQVGPMPPPAAASCQCGSHTSASCGGWVGPCITCPWKEDEYLCDGGDQGTAVRVHQDWSVDGLDLEDTIVHYDTLDGHTHIEPSNVVCVYAPRFAAVRKIYGVLQYDQLDRVAGVAQPLPPIGVDDVQIATTTVQPVQPELNLGMKSPSGLRERTPPILVENAQGLIGAHGSLLPFEDFALIRRGLFDNSEKARLAERVEAALVWSHDLAVQVLIDNIQAHEDISDTSPDTITMYELGDSRLRICKIASRADARPGETVEFTLRFDNVGGQAVGNVTIIDNLTTRLEYVEGSQQCTLKSNFAAVENQGSSLVLRWEIIDPIEAGEGGVIRFQCRVR